jgi:prolyl-tRNA synthetase
MDTKKPVYDMKHEMGITTKKSDDISEWYIQVITKGKFIEYYDVSGCYVLLPNSYSIWENIQAYVDGQYKKMGVKNVSFPLFITEKNLSREKKHLEGFTPEVAWVTKAGKTDLNEQLAIRPTSECAMYPIFSDLIESRRDLPLKYNQWCNVVRWEFKDCIPFLRSREFIWSEMHGCYNCNDTANHDALKILDLYANTYNSLLAVPTIKGKKTNNEKFAGADATYTIECYIPVSGKGIQAATAHNLGQNFSKMFDIKIQDSTTNAHYIHQISCGITTRSIGVMLMNHGDDKGAIIPPMVADIQIVIIPIIFKNKTDEVLDKCQKLYDQLLENGYRVKLDNSDHNSGWKFNNWETLGVPLRIEIGPRDVQKDVITLCKRNDFKKITVDDANILSEINNTLKTIQQELYDKAHDELYSHIKIPISPSEFEFDLNGKNLCLIKWCETNECEEIIKEKCKAKSLCIPVGLNMCNSSEKCVICGENAVNDVLFGRSY